MKRKLSKIGPSTFMVSLPIKWVRNLNLKKGDDIDIVEQGNTIIVSSGPKSSNKRAELTLNLSGDNKVDYLYSKSMISNAYKKGYDEILVKTDNPKVLHWVNLVCDELLGLELVEQTDKYSLMRVITTGNNEEFESVLRRSFLVLLAMADNSLKLIKEGDYEHLSEISNLDRTINKFTDYVKRLLSLYGYSDMRSTPHMYIIAWQLEKIGNEYKDICNQISNMKINKIDKNIIDIYEKVNGMLHLFHEAFYNKDSKKILELAKRKYMIEKEVEKLYGKIPKNQYAVLFYLNSLATKIHAFSGPYFGVIL